MTEPLVTEPLSRAWEVWAAQNLLRGVARDKIEARLLGEGLSATETKAALDALEDSALLEASAPMMRDARRWQMLCRLAAHRRSTSPQPHAVLRREGLSPEDLHAVFRVGSIPVVIPGFLHGNPVMTRWTPAALAERFGEAEITITVSREDDPNYAQTFRRPTESLQFGAFAERIAAGERNDFYLVALNHALKGPLGAMLDDLILPEGYLDAPLSERSLLWMGPAGTLTALHHDRTDVLFLQVYGRKRWLLIAPTERALLEQVQGVATLVPPESLQNVLIKEVVLEPGDALLVPLGWWHQVQALDASVSLSVSLDPEGSLEFFRPGQA